LVHDLPAALSAINERANVKWWQYNLVIISWKPDWPVEKLRELFALASQATIVIFGLPDELKSSIDSDHTVIATSNPCETLARLDKL
jgi:hypothetical protein